MYYSENKGDVVVYQWIEEVREFLNQKASELHIDSLGTVMLIYILFCHESTVCMSINTLL